MIDEAENSSSTRDTNNNRYKPMAINVAEVVEVIEQTRPTNIDKRIEQP